MNAPDDRVNVDLIPDDLKSYPQWVAWDYIERDGRKTKIPIDPHTGRKASCDDPDTWGMIDDALAANRYGIGFEFTIYDPYVGIDVDKCRNPDTGELSNDAKWLIYTMNSYTEITPSERGIHIIVHGFLPENGRRRKGSVEMYSAGRFFTMTGRHLPGTPRSVEMRNAQLLRFYNRLFQEQDEPKPRPAMTRSQSDEDVLRRARNAKNGSKFDALWSGNWSSLGYGSQSEADSALCRILGFWCDGDRNQVDRLFRQSNLYRDKWDTRRGAMTYGERTLATIGA